MKLILFLLFTFMGISALAQGQLIAQQIKVDGIKRNFTSYLPVDATTEGLPVIISLHGGFASPKGQFKLADFRPIADKDKFIVVCPASKQGWQDAKKVSVDDVKFIDQLITYIIHTYHADADRIYVTGISKGGFM